MNLHGKKLTKRAIKYFNRTIKMFEDGGCPTLEKEYKPAKERWSFICTCGSIGHQTPSDFKKGRRCKECAIEDRSERYRMSIESVRKIFEDQGCELLSDKYVNSDTRLRYKCSCGNISHTYVFAMKKGWKYGCQYPRGEDSPFWNSELTEEDRVRERKIPGYHEWILSVYERDDFTCQKCKEKGGKLNAHHILGYAEHKELRTELSNGITLCEKCHKDFHIRYGLKGFTDKDLREFLGKECEDR